MKRPFKVVKIGTDAYDRLFATLVADAPVKQQGILKVRGRATEYRMSLDELPEGVELKTAREGDGKLFTKELKDLPVVDFEMHKPMPHMPYVPTGYNIEEKEVEVDGHPRVYKWLILKQA
jgi:hypothetical protein